MNGQPSLKSVSELLKGAWAQYKQHFNVLVPIMLLAGVGLYLQTIILFTMAPKVVVVGQYGMHASSSGLAGYGILALIATLVYIIGMLWGITALINRVNKLDQPMTLSQAFTNAKPLIWPMFLTGLLVAIFTIIGLILIVIPGIIVGVWLSFSLYIVVAENKSGMEAIKASKAYVQGYWWPIFGRALVIGIIIAVISGVIGAIANAIIGIRLGTLIQDIVGLGLAPLAILYQYAVYLDIKKIKSGSGGTSVAASVPVAPAA